jgi:hypothetical protein
VLLVARSGRADCAELDALLQDWDGQLTVLLRKRLHRHIGRCPICGDRKRTVLRPAMLLGLAPLAALPVRAIAPAGLRDQVLRLASSSKPDAVAHRAAVAGRTGTFGEHGFPKPLDPPKSHWWQAPSAQAAAAVATVAVIAVAALAIAGGGNQPRQVASGISPTVTTSRTGTVAPGGSTRPGQPGTSPRPGASGQLGASGQPGPSGPRVTGPPSQGTQASSPAATSPVTSPAATKPVTKSPSASPTAPASKTPAPTPAPTEPAPSSSPASPVTPGTLAVSPTTVVLTLLGPTTLTISASGGPVTWSISEPSSLIGKVDFSPASGTLQAGRSVKVAITVSGLAVVDSTLTVNPGGHSVTVLLGVL